MESDTYYLVPLQSPPQMFSASGLSSCSYILICPLFHRQRCIHNEVDLALLFHTKSPSPHIEETGCNLVHRKTPRLISLSIAWYPCIQNPRPRHSQVNWRLSIRQFSWLQFNVTLRLPKTLQWLRAFHPLCKVPRCYSGVTALACTKFSIKSIDT